MRFVHVHGHHFGLGHCGSIVSTPLVLSLEISQDWVDLPPTPGTGASGVVLLFKEAGRYVGSTAGIFVM